MNELALFAGAGGGLLASHLLGWEPICAVEISEPARRVLLARQDDGTLPVFPIWDDIRTFDGLGWRGRVDVVSGGFPCQPYSTVSRGRNKADDLWSEMRRIVAETAPRYVFAENTSRKAIDCAAEDLQAMGYQTRCIALGAADLGGDHIRKRYWLRAYTDNDRKSDAPLNDEARSLSDISSGVWGFAPGDSGMADGMASWMDRYSASGNGQVPIVAATAWRLMSFQSTSQGEQHGK